MYYYANVAAAKQAHVHATMQMARMHAELVGCDWCCGGGNESYSRYQSGQRNAADYLRARGHDVPTLRLDALCSECGYHDAATGTHTCSKCTQLEKD